MSLINKVKTLGRTKSLKGKSAVPGTGEPGSGSILAVGTLATSEELKGAVGGVANCHFETCPNVSDVASKLGAQFFDAVIFDPDNAGDIYATIRGASVNKDKAFIVVFSKNWASSPSKRVEAFTAGANMVTSDPEAITAALNKIITRSRQGDLTCPVCGLDKFFEDDLVDHMVLYHFNADTTQEITCPIAGCGKKFEVGTAHKSKSNYFTHMRNEHGKAARKEIPVESRNPTPVWPFALVVVQNSQGKFLVVQQFANSGYWVPGGRVNATEDLQKAAIRNTLEQAGIEIELTGILRVSYTPQDNFARLRVLYVARPVDENAPLKTVPDYESLGAAWVTVDELANLKCRGKEPNEWFPYVAQGGKIYPMDLMLSEGAPPKAGA
eukprot:CAMPEP_0184695048 /NCGR_PEP_ID=MMETSP0313-20130426/2803_1 /TAXON_ID=2792 /ORGANISM="Porphyridium aerugineum, Strain SAG 1380-2" /LENGTH=381 /DNA_ID=CAMNT_0027153435 /DNA_START=263 /DNA_END=1408 /DNA_ORIENTATION=+